MITNWSVIFSEILDCNSQKTFDRFYNGESINIGGKIIFY